jgi:hypothetical protein
MIMKTVMVKTLKYLCIALVATFLVTGGPDTSFAAKATGGTLSNTTAKEPPPTGLPNCTDLHGKACTKSGQHMCKSDTGKLKCVHCNGTKYASTTELCTVSLVPDGSTAIDGADGLSQD